MRATFRVIAAGALFALAATTAACSVAGTSSGETPPPSSTAPVPEAPAGLELSGATDDDGDGEYARVSLPDDSPVYDYDPAVVQPDVLSAGFTEQDITEAQRVAADFAVEEGLDSILVASDRTDEWYEQNADKFSPANLPYVQEALADRTPGKTLGGLVDNDVNNGRDTEGGYRLVSDGGPRISRLDIQNSGVLLSPSGNLAFEFTGRAHRPGVNSTGEQGEEVLGFTLTYSFEQIDGAWLIDGWNNTFVYDR